MSECLVVLEQLANGSRAFSADGAVINAVRWNKEEEDERHQRGRSFAPHVQARLRIEEVGGPGIQPGGA